MSVQTSLAARLTGLALALALAACADSTAPARTLASGVPLRSGGTTDTTTTASGGGGGGGGGGGTVSGGVSKVPTGCGTLSNVVAQNITVYTTRSGIGFTGDATNCGTQKEGFEVDFTDQNTDPACAVSMPHFIAVKYTDPGLTTTWQVNSTLVPCQGQLHVFDVRLWDTRTGQTLATTVASAYM